MKPPFVLVPDQLSNDTQEALAQLLDLAQRGELIGVAFAGMLRRRRYFVNVAGEAFRNPTFARGCVSALDDELGLRMRGRPNDL
jgi:hypothetical protein